MIAATTAGPLIEIDRCNLPQEAGPCRAARPSWSYDRVTRECQPFLYGGICTLYFFLLQIPTSLISKGCRGNANRFETEGECQTACVNGTSGISTLPAPAPPRRAGGFVFLFNLFLFFFVLSHSSFVLFLIRWIHARRRWWWGSTWRPLICPN